MTALAAARDAYGVLTEPTTLQIQRVLPGPVDRVWAYLVDSDLRRKWLAAGEMEPRVGSSVDLVWRNSELSDPPGVRPEGFGEEHRLTSEVTAFEPMRRLAITWGSTGGVTFELEPSGDEVLLTVTHHRVEDRGVLLNVSAGWHAHLDVLTDRLAGREPASFWERWTRLKADYQQRYAST